MDSNVLSREVIHADPELDDRSGCGPAFSLRKSAATQARCSSYPSVLPFPFSERGAKLILDQDRRVIWASAGATLLASGHSCISITNGELGGRTRHCDALLRDLFVDAELSPARMVELLVAREASHCPELFVRAQSYAVPGERFILLTIRSLERELDGIPDLSQLFGLTRTEQQITGMMIQGQSVTEIGRRLNKSVLTVRTHVKRVYSKLDVRTKEQLFSTVMKLMVD